MPSTHFFQNQQKWRCKKPPLRSFPVSDFLNFLVIYPPTHKKINYCDLLLFVFVWFTVLMGPKNLLQIMEDEKVYLQGHYKFSSWVSKLPEQISWLRKNHERDVRLDKKIVFGKSVKQHTAMVCNVLRLEYSMYSYHARMTNPTAWRNLIRQQKYLIVVQ